MVVLPAGRLLELWDKRSLLAVMLVQDTVGGSRLRCLNRRGRIEACGLSRLAHDTRIDLDAGAPPEETAERLREWEERASARAGEIDLELLWEVVHEERRGECDLKEMAQLALGESGPEERSALLRAMLADPVFFERKGSAWNARTERKVEEARHRIAAQERRSRQEESFRNGVEQALQGQAPGAGFRKEHAGTIEGLEGLLVIGASFPGASRALAMLPRSAKERAATDEEAAFDVLVALGVFTEDEDLGRRRLGIPDTFPPEVEDAAAAAVARGPSPSDREDLRALELWAIDEASTLEVDDAVGLEGPGADPGTWRVAVAVADPAAFVQAGDVLDREALGRALTHYLPTGNLPMLPGALSHEAASLTEDEERPALVFHCTVSEEGDLLDCRPSLATVASVRRITYAEANAAVESGQDPLLRIHGLMKARRRRRHEAGAIVLSQPELEVRVVEGRVEVQRTEPGSAGKVLVSEMMVLVGEAAARWLQAEQAPTLYRRQTPPEGLPTVAKDPAIIDAPYDPVRLRSILRCMRPSEVRTEPGVHAGLGLELYCQATSPLRRYQDLVVHRQIRSVLTAGEPEYTAEDLQRIAATTEVAEQSMRKAERQSREFWFLRYLEERVGEEVDAVVLETRSRHTLAEIVPYLRTVSLEPKAHHTPGETIRVRITKVRPRAGVARAEEVG